jgi:hypothetical protein
MRRSEFIQRCALTLGFDTKALRHLEAYADAVGAIAPFDPEERENWKTCPTCQVTYNTSYRHHCP